MMRELFLLLLFAGACIALEDPPVQEVVDHNKNLNVSELMGDANINVSFGDYNASAGAKIITVLPAVNNRIPANAESVLWAWREEYEEEMDIGNYSCSISNHSIQTIMYFEFRNESTGVVLSGADYLVNIPFSEELLETANGTETLTVILEGEYLYEYECPISNGTITYERSIEIRDKRQFIIEPGEAEFFLARPVLGEQWYKNNHFDTLIFSRKSIYKAEISMDGAETAYARIYNFTIMLDPVGAAHIMVDREDDFRNASMGNYEIAYWATPVVRGNNSFSHLYEINHTYEAWGPRIMKIKATDFFRGTHEYSREILSRKLTAGGMSETGEPAGNKTHYRPSEPEMEADGLERRLIPPNQAMLAVLVAMFGVAWYFQRGRKRANPDTRNI